MPELPEVETVRRHLAAALIGANITSAESCGKLRSCPDSDELNAFCRRRRIVAVRRRGKYLLLLFTKGDGMIVHLGMTGYFVLADSSDDAGGASHVRARWFLDDSRVLSFCDPRRFGQIILCPGQYFRHWPAELARLGPEPLSNRFTGSWLFAAGRGRSCSIKSLIMDQQQVVGVGNIYASEALFRAGIPPQMPAQYLNEEQCRRLVRAIRRVLREAIAAGGTTISDFRTLDGSEGGFAVKLQVYDREGEACYRCGTAIARTLISGRSSFFCPKCQPAAAAVPPTDMKRRSE
ncbi:MAG: bifunctional DNA-formamidopyrimidine glycosylase/DNA-(apurinic or apyrimidinic site) lyase [Lentisphaerae bacterium]|jgi:formamidopyrimidine-DNA glycosylase|nr:bifunctional DNA-formamidopyrimidine glycosylase/DNA-(apurinic or apyrimidinic site) lyase [Lentisphaerota bacterium]